MNTVIRPRRPATDKSGEPETCEMCGFRAGNHLATCPLAEQSDAVRNTLVRAAFKARDRRFTGESITGFGSL